MIAAMMSVSEAIRSQRACRQFTSEPVDDAVVEELLEAACRAPSAENRQPWRFVVVLDGELRAALADLMRQLWEAAGRAHSEPRLAAGLFRDVDDGFAAGFASAPVMIVVGGDTTVTPSALLPSSVFPAVQNLLLAATEAGLGSCLTTIATIRADAVRSVVGFPAEIEPLAVIPVGHPAKPLGPPRREPAASKAHRNRYGQGWG